MNHTTIENLIQTYPRKRPPLSKAIQLIYKDQYKQSRSGQGFINWLCQKVESWMHWQIVKNTSSGNTLELGAGTLNHIKYELIKKQHTNYDIVEPSTYFYNDSNDKIHVSNFYSDIKEIPAGIKYNRIISVATLEHVTDLPDMLNHCTKLLNKEGAFQKEMMLHEHVNSAKEVISLLSYYFRDVKIKRFPLPWHHLSLHCYIEAKNSIRHD